MRRTILEALSRTTALEHHLAQAECLRSLFVALNDESSTVRSLTIQLAGHISATNPAYVMPALRRHLMQLLSDMDHSPDSRQQEGACSAVGLGCWGWREVGARLGDCQGSAARGMMFRGRMRVGRWMECAASQLQLLLLPLPRLQRARGCWAC